MKAVVYQHEEREGPGLLGPALAEAGFELELRFRRALPEDADADLVVVMGGPMGVYEASRFPFLGDELRVLRARVEQARPVLGICLGAQLLAAAAGAKVIPGTNGFELGFGTVELTEEGASDPAFSSSPSPLPVVHWHGDTYEPVPGATRLAVSTRYREQAFRLGPSLGLQFHPELDPDTFRRWVNEAPEDLRRAGRSRDEIDRHDLPSLEQAQGTMKALLQRIAKGLAVKVKSPRAGS